MRSSGSCARKCYILRRTFSVCSGKYIDSDRFVSCPPVNYLGDAGDVLMSERPGPLASMHFFLQLKHNKKKSDLRKIVRIQSW